MVVAYDHGDKMWKHCTIYRIYALTDMSLLILQSLALAHCDVDDGKVLLSPWTETDFRTGEAPWWS